MNLFRKFAVIAAGAAMAAASPALADAITLDAGDIGESFTLNFDGVSDGTTVTGLTGTTTLTLAAVDGTSYTFRYSVTNTTSDPVNSRISSLGFDTDPTLAGASSTGTFSFVDTSQNVPTQGQVDVCFKAGGSNSCSGSGGLTDGQTGTGTLTLSFSQPVSSLTLSDFFVRYQSITGAGNVTSAVGSGTTTTSGGTTSGGSTGGTPVPEPGMLGLLGMGLIGVALLRRRRQPSLRPMPMPLAA